MRPPVAGDVGAPGQGLLSGAPSHGFRTGVHCFAVAVLCFAVLLSAGLGREGDTAAHLSDTDDFMRTAQVVDWLDGQGWRDTVQRRLNPPEGVDMHWSRLADLPLAGTITLAEPWVGRAGAIHLAVLTVPPLLGALLAVAFLWGAAALLPDRRTPPPVAMVATLILPLLQYMLAGRVDHHGLQLVLTALAIGCLLRAFQPSDIRPALGLGIVSGISLSIGLETLPFVGSAAVILSLAWVWRHATASTLACFGGSLTASSLALLLLTLPPSAWTTAACDRMSLAHAAPIAAVLAAGVAALALEGLRPGASWPWRLATVGCVGMAGLALAVAIFPQCAGGPYSGLADDIRYWLLRVNEAQSLADLFGRKPGVAVSAIILPAVALVALGWQWMRASDRSDPRRFVLAVLVLSGLAVTAWQVRGTGYAGLAAGFALIPVAVAAGERSRRSRRIPAKLGLRVCVPLACAFAVLAPLKLLPVPAAPGGDGWKTGCDVKAVLDALNDPAGLGTTARTVAAPIDAGPALLFLTRHKVLAAPITATSGGSRTIAASSPAPRRRRVRRSPRAASMRSSSAENSRVCRTTQTVPPSWTTGLPRTVRPGGLSPSQPARASPSTGSIRTGSRRNDRAGPSANRPGGRRFLCGRGGGHAHPFVRRACALLRRRSGAERARG